MRTQSHPLVNFSRWAACALTVAVLAPAAHAQLGVNRGFEQTAVSTATFKEANRQRDIQIMEVQIKPLRLVWVDYVDKDGTARKEQIWYSAWRAINRPITVNVTDESDPVNELDPLPGPQQFVPACTLVTYDDPKTEIPSQILPDEILPQALAAIRKIEGNDFMDHVTVVQDFPAAIAPDAEQQPWIYGVAMWRGVNPDTDFFKVLYRGFSNGYERQADGNSVARKVIVQKYRRPGDRFDPNIREFAFDGAPVWAYQPDSPKTRQPPQTTSNLRPTVR